MIFKCKACKAKDKQISYLEKLVDNLLARNGIQTVSEPENIEDLLDKPEPLPEGAERYGEG